MIISILILEKDLIFVNIVAKALQTMEINGHIYDKHISDKKEITENDFYPYVTYNQSWPYRENIELFKEVSFTHFCRKFTNIFPGIELEKFLFSDWKIFPLQNRNIF